MVMGNGRQPAAPREWPTPCMALCSRSPHLALSAASVEVLTPSPSYSQCSSWNPLAPLPSSVLSPPPCSPPRAFRVLAAPPLAAEPSLHNHIVPGSVGPGQRRVQPWSSFGPTAGRCWILRGPGLLPEALVLTSSGLKSQSGPEDSPYGGEANLFSL